MAVDNRNFVNTFANEGGGDILCEDKRLEELTDSSKIASSIDVSDSQPTQFIPLQDTDGNLVKISPASFEGAIKNVLGKLLVANDKDSATSVRVPTLTGSGASTDFGSNSLSSLASLLGVVPYILSPTADIDSTTIDDTSTPGAFKIGTSASPFNAAGILYKFQRNDSYCQLFIGTAVEIIGYRIKGSPIYGWSTWKSVTLST